jgi:hypothetical protein
VDPVLQSGDQPDQAGPVAQQRPQVTDLQRGDSGLGEQVGPEQLGQGARIDLVILEPGRGNRLTAAGVDQVCSSSNSANNSTSQPQP